MSLKDLAEQMKSRGRKGDTELIHMTRGEVAGLQQLAMAAGGTLTINPDTGLPEASFLRQLLPTIIGIGVGAATMNPMAGAAAGAAVGGMTNKQDPLMGAVMGGFGGYGGAGLGAGLTGAGAGAAQNAAMSGLTDTAARNLAAGQATTQFTAQPMMSQIGQGAQALMQPGGAGQFVQSLGGGMGALKTGAMAAAPMMYESMMPRPMGAMEEDDTVLPRYDYTAGLTGDYYGMGGDGSTRERQFFTQPTFTRRAAQGGIMQLDEGGDTDPKDPARGMTGASAEAMRYLMGQSEMSPATAAQQTAIQNNLSVPKVTPSYTRASSAPANRDFGGIIMHAMGRLFGGNNNNPRFSYDPMSQQYTRMAEGGIASLAKGGSLDLEDGDFIVPADVTAFAGGGSTDAGMQVLAKKIGAQPIRGPGTGLSDDIPARINGKQPARVANGEMLVRKPGKEGAKKLYAMMDNIRKQATGKKKQIRPVNVDKALA